MITDLGFHRKAYGRGASVPVRSSLCFFVSPSFKYEACVGVWSKVLILTFPPLAKQGCELRVAGSRINNLKPDHVGIRNRPGCFIFAGDRN